MYSTACRDSGPKPGMDFVPLSVDYQERFSSVGATSGGYNKRDGRPGEREILTSRLIDRPLRPLIDSRWRHETQLLSWVLSYDEGKSTESMAICAASAALYLSDVPIFSPVAGVEVGYIQKEEEGKYEFVVNPTLKEMEGSKLKLTVAGTEKAVLMIEGAAEFLTEGEMIEAIGVAHVEIKKICGAIIEFGAVAGKPKYTDSLISPSDGITAKVNELMEADVNDAYSSVDKSDQVRKIDSAYAKVVEVLEPDFPGEEGALKSALKELFSQVRLDEMSASYLIISANAPSPFPLLALSTVAEDVLPRQGRRQESRREGDGSGATHRCCFWFPPSRARLCPLHPRRDAGHRHHHPGGQGHGPEGRHDRRP
jgi:polyribonucleotide nucleotidyltransferase